MATSSASRPSITLASSFLLVLAFLAGSAWADGDKLDDAKQNTAKAIATLRSIEGDKPPADAHRKKAIDLLTRAQSEILKAKGE